jgi:hypothetical protein
MNTLTHRLLALSAATLMAFSPLLSHAERVTKPVADYTVFVDPPTGFVFVRLPEGWKFVGKVESAQVQRLPAGVVTALLPEERDGEDATRLAVQGTR